MRLLFFAIFLSLLVACNEKFDADFSRYQLELQLLIPEDAQMEIDSMEAITVHFTNKNKEYAFSALTDTNGLLKIEDIEAGIYSLNVAEEYKEKGLKIVLNGAAELLITENSTQEMPLTSALIQTEGGGFVIREYYYSGSKTSADKLYLADQYVEIYNNGSDTLYADSILLVELESYAISPNSFAYMQSDSIVAKTIWANPGTGRDYPIAPGTGYIIAQNAMNHQSDPNGNPNSPVNMGDADFEFWSDKKVNGDIDFPAPNMIDKLWVYKGNEFVFHVRGGSAIAIVKLNTNTDDYLISNLVTKGTPTSTSKYYCKINNHNVIDAVEVMQAGKVDVAYKRFDNSVDAGITYIEAGTKSALCVRRKIDRSIAGRTVYKDTNNSTEDFLHDVTPKPRMYEE